MGKTKDIRERKHVLTLAGQPATEAEYLRIMAAKPAVIEEKTPGILNVSKPFSILR